MDKIENNCEEFLKSKGLIRKITVQDAIGDLYKSNGCYNCPDCNQKFESGKYGKSVSAYQNVMRAENASVHPNSHRFAKHTDEIVKIAEEEAIKREKHCKVAINPYQAVVRISML